MHEANKGKKPILFLSIDAEKAFDMLDWDFMLGTLHKFGIGPCMLRWIEALYSKPTAQIQVNGSLSEAFRLYNGTRQGCPLSPLLFVFSLEPFLASIRANYEIKGIEIAGQEYKTSAFVNDIMFYITNATQTKIMGELSS